MWTTARCSFDVSCPGAGRNLVARMRAFTPVFAGYVVERNAGLPCRSDTRISLRSIRATSAQGCAASPVEQALPCRARKDPAAEDEHDAHEERDQDEQNDARLLRHGEPRRQIAHHGLQLAQ